MSRQPELQARQPELQQPELQQPELQQPELQQPELRARQPEPRQPASAGPRPASAVTRLAPDEWAALAPGEVVWVERAGYGFDAGHVDEVSQYQEIIWVDFTGRGRRLLCSGDPVHVWTRDQTED